MKKIFLLSLVLIMCFSPLTAIASDAVDLKIGSASAMPGETVKIDVSLENNTGVLALKLELSYDKQRLKLLTAEDAGLVSGKIFSKTTDKYPYIMLWNSASIKNFDADGVLVSLTFEVLNDAPSGDAFISISYEQENVYDVDYKDVLLNVKDGFITVEGEEKIQSSPTSSGSKRKNQVSKESYVNNEIILTVDKKEMSIFGKIIENDVAPIIRNDRTMLPARVVAEALGAKVLWNETDGGIVTVTKDNTVVVIYIGRDYAECNGKREALDSPAFIENSRTYTPLRFIAEKLGAKVFWEESTQKVTIVK